MTSSAYRSPEFLLSNLNRVARELRGAMHILNSPALGAQLTKVIRKLLVAEVFSDHWIVAVSGSQGAGKTTLLQLMYGLDQGPEDQRWLAPNEGRGECLPLLIVEDEKAQAPQGYVRRLRPLDEQGGRFGIEEDKVDKPAEFRAAANGYAADVLLPVLEVPPRYLRGPRQAFLLLPGYEPVDKNNEEWQALMRLAVVGAAAGVVVTNQTKLADADQLEITLDLRRNQLAGTTPIVVISKTEPLSEDEEAKRALRRSAAEIFGIPQEQAEKFVICSGTKASETWRRQLAEALQEVTAGSGLARQRQLERLNEVLQNDLAEVLEAIENQIEIGNAQMGERELAHIEEYLKVFDSARTRLRKSYARALGDQLDAHFGESAAQLDKALVANHEGLINKVKNIGETFTEHRMRVQSTINAAWTSPQRFDKRHGQILFDMTSQALGRKAEAALTNAGDAGTAQVQHRDTGLASIEPSETTRANLAVLFYPERDDEGKVEKSTKELAASIKLLPALTLEFARLSTSLPQEFGIDPATLEMQSDTLAATQRVHQNFNALTKTTGEVIKGIAIMLAIDGAADGKIDTIPALLGALGLGDAAASGGTASTGLAAFATTAAGLAAVGGLLAVCVAKEIRSTDSRVSREAREALVTLRDKYRTHYLEHFDMMLDHVRETLSERLALRFRLDERLMRRDRLFKAIADVKSLKSDLEAHLGETLHALMPGAALK